MNYAIIILQERIHQLDSAYKKYVTIGEVPKTSPIATDNRKKSKELRCAIKLLTNNLTPCK